MAIKLTSFILFLSFSSMAICGPNKTERKPAEAAVDAQFTCLNLDPSQAWGYVGPSAKQIGEYCKVSQPFSVSLVGQKFLVCCTSTGQNPPPSDRR